MYFTESAQDGTETETQCTVCGTRSPRGSGPRLTVGIVICSGTDTGTDTDTDTTVQSSYIPLLIPVWIDPLLIPFWSPFHVPCSLFAPPCTCNSTLSSFSSQFSAARPPPFAFSLLFFENVQWPASGRTASNGHRARGQRPKVDCWRADWINAGATTRTQYTPPHNTTPHHRSYSTDVTLQIRKR